MADKFSITVKEPRKKITSRKKITFKIGMNVKQEIAELAQKTGRSQNEVICLALYYVLEHSEFYTKPE